MIGWQSKNIFAQKNLECLSVRYPYVDDNQEIAMASDNELIYNNIGSSLTRDAVDSMIYALYMDEQNKKIVPSGSDAPHINVEEEDDNDEPFVGGMPSWDVGERIEVPRAWFRKENYDYTN